MNKNEKMKRYLFMILCVILTSLIYSLLHETGHALVAILCGARITNFHILGLDAHVSHEGGSFNAVTQSLVAAGGVLLPTLVVFIISLFYKYKDNKFFLRLFFCIFSLSLIFSNITWFFASITYLYGLGGNQDTVDFIESSGIHPIAVICMTLVLVVLQSIVIWKKEIAMPLLKRFSAKRIITFMSLFIFIIGVFYIVSSYISNRIVFEYSVSERITSQENSIVPINIEKEGPYELHITLDNPNNGMIMDVLVLDNQENEIFQCIGEQFDFYEPFNFKKGDYFVKFIYLRSEDEFLNHISKYTFDEDTIDRLTQTFNIGTKKDTFKIEYTITVKKK